MHRFLATKGGIKCRTVVLNGGYNKKAALREGALFFVIHNHVFFIQLANLFLGVPFVCYFGTKKGMGFLQRMVLIFSLLFICSTTQMSEKYTK